MNHQKSPKEVPGSNYGFPNHEDGIQSGNLTDSKENEHVTRHAPLDSEPGTGQDNGDGGAAR